jgi:DNA polymerase elongation subunit (family B)
MRHTSSKPAFVTNLSPDHLYTYTTTIGSRVYVRARATDGRAVFVESSYRPTYYLPVDTHTGYESFDGHPLQPHTCKSIREGREFLEKHPEAYGNIQPEYMLLADTYGGDEIVPDLDRLYVWNIDIEVDSEDAFAPPDDPFNEVTAITVMWKHAGQSGTVVYGTKPYTASDSITYVECASEDDLLTKFLTDWRGKGDYPDIVTGWNVQFYDLPYLVNRMTRLWNGEDVNALSPFRQIATRQVTFGGRSQTVVDIRGIAVLDYYELYRKFTFSQQESYRLDHIAHVELGKRKLSYAEYKSLSRLYRENYQLFISYNVQDVQLVNDLDEKMKFIDLVCALAYSAKANYADTFKQVRLWDVMIYHYLRERGKQIPPRREVEKTEQYVGAYVKDPQVAQHAWVCSFDVASMYPHIIRQWNLSPETLVGRKVPGITVDQLLSGQDVREYLTDGDHEPTGYALAANGVLTRRETEGFLPAMLKTLYDERVRFKNLATEAKKQRELLDKQDPQYTVLTKQIAAYNNQQMVRKVNLNSAYGALGSNYFRFYDTDMAEAVTVTGQYVIRHIANRVNAFLNKTFGTTEDYVIASDTDSIYVRLERVAQRYNNPDEQKTVDFLDQFCEKAMQKVIDKAFVEIAQYLNVAVPCLSMKREVIARRGVMTAKKRYILDVMDTEGVRHPEPKLKMMGIETAKSSTPAICREMLTKALTLMLRNTEADVWEYVREQREVFGRASFEQVAFPRSVNSLSKYETDTKSLPITVRGAMVYNTHITNESGNYEPIKAGQKIKFAYLRMPNRFQSNVISAPDGCPPAWHIEQVLDYETQWEKSFIKPLQGILSCIGWNTEKQDVLF